MKHEQISAMERQMQKEHRKDVEALGRLKRFLPSNSLGATSQVTAQSVVPFVPEEDSPLKDAIRNIMNNDPVVRWTNTKMFKYLTEVGFKLNAKQPIYSIGQATQRLFDAGEIKLVRKGAGSTPNFFRGLTALEQAARESAEEVEAD